jgi:hypothetical protein
VTEAQGIELLAKLDALTLQLDALGRLLGTVTVTVQALMLILCALVAVSIWRR